MPNISPNELIRSFGTMARYSLAILEKDNKKDRRALFPVFLFSVFYTYMPNILHKRRQYICG
jgi:hypothetical protein